MNTEIVANVIIPILGAILVYCVVPFVKSKTTETQKQNVYFYVKLAVQAAEQVFDYKNAGRDKKDFVIEKLNSIGIEINEHELDIMIESAVKELKLVQENIK